VLALEHLLARNDLGGPVNLVAPEPVTNAIFTTTLGKVLGRPTVVPTSAFALRAALGGAADELLLASARVFPAWLQGSGFAFCHPQLEVALRQVLGRRGRGRKPSAPSRW
jgi:hypothetical protein